VQFMKIMYATFIICVSCCPRNLYVNAILCNKIRINQEFVIYEKRGSTVYINDNEEKEENRAAMVRGH